MQTELLQSILETYQQDTSPSLPDIQETTDIEEDYPKSLKSLHIARETINNLSLEQAQKFKEKTFRWVRRLSSRYLIVVGALVLLNGILSAFEVNFLSDNVLIAILTTTTITIVGLPAAIIYSLFPRNNK